MDASSSKNPLYAIDKKGEIADRVKKPLATYIDEAYNDYKRHSVKGEK